MARLNIRKIIDCASAVEWEAWLERNHASDPEAWLRLAKKGSGAKTVSRAEALEIALCYGWIDGQARTQDEAYWLQRFTPRTRRSKWSKINCEAAEALIRAGRMKPAGLAAVEAAKADGRWAAAYAPPSRIEVPADLAAALEKNPRAAAFFSELDSRWSTLRRFRRARRAAISFRPWMFRRVRSSSALSARARTSKERRSAVGRARTESTDRANPALSC